MLKSSIILLFSVNTGSLNVFKSGEPEFDLFGARRLRPILFLGLIELKLLLAVGNFYGPSFSLFLYTLSIDFILKFSPIASYIEGLLEALDTDEVYLLSSTISYFFL